jgi:hypothetical protein
VVKFYRVGRTSNSKTIPYLGLIYSNGKGETFLIIYVYCLALVDGKYICPIPDDLYSKYIEILVS